MRRRTIGMGIALAAAAAGVAWLFAGGEPAFEDAAREPAEPTTTARLEGAAPPEARQPSPAPPAPAPTPEPPKKERVQGTLRVGGVAPARFTVQVEGDRRRQSPFPIEGIDGAFDADGVPGGRSRLRVVKIGERDVDLLFARGDGDLQTLEAGEPVGASLDVVDRATKAPLHAAHVLRWDGPDLPTGVAPPFDRREAYGRNFRGTGRNARIELPASVGRAIWIVVDELHAWKAVEVRYGEQATQTVELEPGSQAHVVVLGWSEVRERGGRLRFLGPGGEEAFPRPDPAGSVWLDGIPLGRYEVLLRTGEEPGEVRARADLDATSPGNPEVRLDARDGAGEPHRIVVTLDYGKEWGKDVGTVRDRISAHFTALGAQAVYEDDALEEPAEPDRPLRLASRPLPPGAYRVELRPFGWRGEATIADADVHLTASIPPPGWVVCETHADNCSVWWRQAGQGMMYVQDPLRPIRVFPGRLVLWAKARGYRQTAEQTVEVRSGQKVPVRFTLEKEQGLVVTIRDRDGPIRDAAWTALLETTGSTGRTVERHAGEGASVKWYDVVALSAVVRIEPPLGYATPDERTITLHGGDNEVVFDLEKKTP